MKRPKTMTDCNGKRPRTCGDELHESMLDTMLRRVDAFIGSKPASDLFADVRRRLDDSPPHEFPDLSGPIGMLLREAATQSIDTSHTDLRYDVVAECLRFVRRDVEHVHHAASLILAVTGEWQDINWGCLYMTVNDASDREGTTGKWQPITTCSSLTDVYVLALSIVYKMGRCEKDEMPVITHPLRGSYRVRRPVRPNLPTYCIWRTGMHHCARAAHICAVFSRSSSCDLARVLVCSFTLPRLGCGENGFSLEDKIGMELRLSMDAVSVASVVSDMIMLHGMLFSAQEYSQIISAIGSLLWPDFAKFVILANAQHNCAMTFVPVACIDSFNVWERHEYGSWFVQPCCMAGMHAAFVQIVHETMAADTSAARSQIIARNKLDHGLLAAWALTAVHPFADGGLRRLIGEDVIRTALKIDSTSTTFNVHAVDILGIFSLKIPVLHPTTDRRSPAFVEDLKMFLGQHRPGVIESS